MTTTASVPLQGASFPVPVNIPFARLGLPAAAENLFVQASIPLEGRFKYRNGIVTPFVAFRLQRMFHFGRADMTPLESQTYKTVNRRFFNGAGFFRNDGEVKPVEVRLRETNPFADGDTAKVISFKSGERWVKYKDGISVRMDGIDTPESNPSSKLSGHVRWISKYLQDEHDVAEGDMKALSALVGARLVYLGKLAGVVTNAFGGYFSDIGIRLAPAYMLRATHPDLCDTLDLWDKYGRIIGRILAGGENQGEDLLAGFLETVLPGAMRQAGEEQLGAYQAKIGRYAKLLAGWKHGKPELYRAVGLESAPVPTQVFGEDEGSRLAKMWTDFCARHPEAANDLQTMLAFIGVAPPYPKYRGHLTALDLSAELFALGGVPDVSAGHGLTFDPIFRFVRPIVSDNYPSPVFLRYGTKMTDIEDLSELDPPDCRDGIGCGTS